MGDGSNRWSAVHRLDAARLFRLALEAAPPGTRLNAIGDEGVPFRDIAEVIGRYLNVPVTGISAEEADGHFGLFVLFASFDVPASSALTQKRFGWHRPTPGSSGTSKKAITSATRPVAGLGASTTVRSVQKRIFAGKDRYLGRQPDS
jgi:nucleoside-diphosphate-sugar epimerase